MCVRIYIYMGKNRQYVLLEAIFKRHRNSINAKQGAHKMRHHSPNQHVKFPFFSFHYNNKITIRTQC